MKVLVACEISGAVRRAFRLRGHAAWSCDVLPAEDASPHHLTADVGSVLGYGWDLMIAHPPCTYLCNSGVRWLHTEPGRWEQMERGARFFRALLGADIPKVAVENPIPHRYAVDAIGRKYDQVVQPYWFGHDAKKATCLWLRGLPKLYPTRMIRKPRYANQTPSGQNKLGPSPDRSRERARTYDGVAEAMAMQWGGQV